MKHNITACFVSNRYLEGEYIEELCEYYYGLGFDFIYILEDVDGRNFNFIDMPYMKNKVDQGLMQIQQIPHRNLWETYPIFYQEHKHEFNWCALFDGDEFLVLNKHKNIQEFVNDPMFKEADVISVCWRNFGDCGKTYKDPGNVVERFNTPSECKGSEIETKIIIRGDLENTNFFIGHCCIVNNNPYRTVFCNGEHYTRMRALYDVNYTVAALNHYRTKSTEEFIKRKSIGRIDIPDQSCYDTLKESIDVYYTINERTPEKDKLFEEALNKLKQYDAK